MSKIPHHKYESSLALYSKAHRLESFAFFFQTLDDQLRTVSEDGKARARSTSLRHFQEFQLEFQDMLDTLKSDHEQHPAHRIQDLDYYQKKLMQSQKNPLVELLIRDICEQQRDSDGTYSSEIKRVDLLLAHMEAEIINEAMLE